MVFSNILSEIVKEKNKIYSFTNKFNKKKIKMSISEIFKKFLSMQNNVTFLNEIKMKHKDKKRNFFRIFFQN